MSLHQCTLSFKGIPLTQWSVGTWPKAVIRVMSVILAEGMVPSVHSSEKPPQISGDTDCLQVTGIQVHNPYTHRQHQCNYCHAVIWNMTQQIETITPLPLTFWKVPVAAGGEVLRQYGASRWAVVRKCYTVREAVPRDWCTIWRSRTEGVLNCRMSGTECSSVRWAMQLYCCIFCRPVLMYCHAIRVAVQRESSPGEV